MSPSCCRIDNSPPILAKHALRELLCMTSKADWQAGESEQTSRSRCAAVDCDSSVASGSTAQVVVIRASGLVQRSTMSPLRSLS